MDLDAWEHLRPERKRQEILQNFPRVVILLSFNGIEKGTKTSRLSVRDFGWLYKYVRFALSQLFARAKIHPLSDNALDWGSILRGWWSYIRWSRLNIICQSQIHRLSDNHHTEKAHCAGVVIHSFKFIDSRITNKVEKYITHGLVVCTFGLCSQNYLKEKN